jgi:hypothetical protein
MIQRPGVRRTPKGEGGYIKDVAAKIESPPIYDKYPCEDGLEDTRGSKHLPTSLSRISPSSTNL